MKMPNWNPDFSVIVPNRNHGEYLRTCLLSIVDQKFGFNLEVLIQDCASSDDSYDIFKEVENHVKHRNNIRMHWFSEPDDGMYHGIQKGLNSARGGVLSWLNSTDYYQENCLSVIKQFFDNQPKVSWVKGVTDYHSSEDKIDRGKCYLYHKNLLKGGFYRESTFFVQQDSCFWRKDVWKSVRNFPRQMYLAGDFFLWRKFSEKYQLYSLNVPVSVFRLHGSQLSSGDGYTKEADSMPVRCYIRAFQRIFAFSMRRKNRWLINIVYFIQGGFKRSGYYVPLGDRNFIFKHAWGYVIEQLSDTA